MLEEGGMKATVSSQEARRPGGRVGSGLREPAGQGPLPRAEEPRRNGLVWMKLLGAVWRANRRV